MRSKIAERILSETPEEIKVATRLYGDINVKINPKLNKYDDVILFPKKVEKAKAFFAKHGLPDFITKQQEQGLSSDSGKQNSTANENGQQETKS